ncbi:MAG: ECF transporter S component [Clostridiales bacterium]|nr:ECF transporter S component [Clostridiales bacterium]
MKRKLSGNSGKISRMTGIAMLTALVVVLQFASTFIKLGPVSITLALTPIIIGGAIYGAFCGAYLGFIMGAVIFIAGLFGWDGGFVMMLMQESPLLGITVTFGKSIVAGFVSGLAYKLIGEKHEKAATVTASALCPIVNTGVFVMFMVLFFPNLFESAALSDGKSILAYLILTVAGLNFIFEFLANIGLSSAVKMIIHVIKHPKGN